MDASNNDGFVDDYDTWQFRYVIRAQSTEVISPTPGSNAVGDTIGQQPPLHDIMTAYAQCTERHILMQLSGGLAGKEHAVA